jgi:cyclophilin family peptidyl-prolyl cis-trans isomerase/protein-disulfide isomerase
MKTGLIFTLILAMLLTACVPQQRAQTLPAETQPPVLTAENTSTTGTTDVTQDITEIATMVPEVHFTASPPAECAPAPILPEGDAMQQNQIPAISPADWRYGREDAPVTILTYCSYQKTTCQLLVTNLLELQQTYPQDVRIVYRHFPQPEVDDKSLLAARAAEAAGLQDRFWEMTRLLYDRQSEWIALSPQDFTTWLAEQAKSLGISGEQLLTDMDGEEVSQRLEGVIASAAPLALNDTPVVFYNGVLIRSTVALASLEALVKYFLLPEKGYNACPAMTIDQAKHYTATLVTEKGNLVFELYPQQAPWAVNTFVTLAQTGWYDGSGFYRVVPDFVAQGGDPSNSGLGSPGFAYTNEVDPGLRFDQAGMLAMNNQGGDLNGSQFFITYSPIPAFDGSYTIFGKLIEGMDVLLSLRPRSPESDQLLLPPDTISSIQIEVSD